MSGIAGWIGASEPEGLSRTRLLEMTGRLSGRYRGVTSESIQTDAALACAGRNPACVHCDERIISVLHGAFYWKDSALEKAAIEIGPSRVVGAGFLERGPEVLRAIGGAFSVAVVDTVERRLFLACDRMGIEPLYYSAGRDRLLFASNLGSLLAVLPRKPAIDTQAVFNFLYFSCIPPPLTGWTGCHAVRAAEYVLWTVSGTHIGTYWKPEFRERRKVSHISARELRAVVRCGVERNLPAGKSAAFLSGGIDSSTIVGEMTALGRAPVSAYSLGYHGEPESELPYARLTARFYGADHHECYLTPDLLVKGMEEFAAASASPFGNISGPALLAVTRSAEADGVATMVAGDGGDELFAGNAHYQLQARLGLWDSVPPIWRNYVFGPVSRRLPPRPAFLRRVRRYIERASIPMPDRLANFNAFYELGPATVMSTDFLASVDVAGPLNFMRNLFGSVQAESALDRMLALDWTIVLQGSDLPRARLACELSGMSVVFPLLDDDVVAASTRIPANEKMSIRRLRKYYVEAFRDCLPPHIVTKPKQGEGVPFGRWTERQGRVREFVLDSLAALARRGVVSTAFIDMLSHPNGLRQAGYIDQLICHLVMLEQWFQHHVDN